MRIIAGLRIPTTCPPYSGFSGSKSERAKHTERQRHRQNDRDTEKERESDPWGQKDE